MCRRCRAHHLDQIPSEPSVLSSECTRHPSFRLSILLRAILLRAPRKPRAPAHPAQSRGPLRAAPIHFGVGRPSTAAVTCCTARFFVSMLTMGRPRWANFMRAADAWRVAAAGVGEHQQFGGAAVAFEAVALPPSDQVVGSEHLLAELSGVTEVVNLYAAPEQATSIRGRYRAQYVLSERSSLQDKLCRLLDVYQHVHP